MTSRRVSTSPPTVGSSRRSRQATSTSTPAAVGAQHDPVAAAAEVAAARDHAASSARHAASRSSGGDQVDDGASPTHGRAAEHRAPPTGWRTGSRSSSSTIRMTSAAFCTSVRKYASLLRRLISSLSVIRSTASAACEASTSSAPRRVSSTVSSAATTSSPIDGPAAGRSAGHERARQRGREPRQLASRRTVEGVHAQEPARPVRGVRHRADTGRGSPSASNTAGARTPPGAGGRRPCARPRPRSAASAADDQVVAGRAQRALTLDRLPVSRHHPGQARQDQQEQQAEDAAIIGRVADVAGERLGEEHAGRDERHRHQQRDAPDAHLAPTAPAPGP